ncbi:MAG: oxygenase MpaB family protein [Actinomycetota bacterium]
MTLVARSLRLVEIAGDVRSLLPGGSAGLLQLMYPPLGHAVAEHSEFFDDPFGRVYRSIPQIWATITTPEGVGRARVIRDLHRSIGGVDAAGNRYHALEPDTFWWAHATFTWEMFRAVELFWRHPLDSVARETLYKDTVQWYECYGVSTRPVPANYSAFASRFTGICDEVLVLTPAAERAVEIALAGDISLPAIPGLLDRTARPLVAPLGRALVFGCLPASVRQRFALPWRRRDRAAFALLRSSARRGIAALPTSSHRAALRWGMRYVGSRTRDERFQGGSTRLRRQRHIEGKALRGCAKKPGCWTPDRH